MAFRVRGFSGGWTGTSGRVPPPRLLRRLGLPEDAVPTGQRGPGRAATCRTYTVHVTREADGKRLERTIGPGYHSRRYWQRARVLVQRQLLKELGWEG